MKQLFILCAVAMAFTLASCNDKKNNGKLDPNAMIALNAAPTKVELPDNPNRLTAEQVIEQATDIWFWNKAIQPNNSLGRGFHPTQRDLANMRLLMFGNDIINDAGEYEPIFIEGEDVILTKNTGPVTMDTVAYVPNSVLRAAEKQIKAAYANGNYAACYEIFNTAFTFTPITGAEWLELKSKNLQ